MDVVNQLCPGDVPFGREIEVLETDVRDCNEKCKRVNSAALYDAFISSFKLLYDLIVMCCGKKKT